MAEKWPLLLDPRMVPPRFSSPLTDEVSRVRVRGRPISPSNPSSMPRTAQPWSISAERTTARITAFSPGASPPLVSTPMRRIGAGMSGAPPASVGLVRRLAGRVTQRLTRIIKGRDGGQGGEEGEEASGDRPAHGPVDRAGRDAGDGRARRA